MSNASLSMFQVDAFVRGPFTGNPAAVVLLPGATDDQRWPDDSWLQGVAASNQLSETAFLCPELEVPRLRWFTPEAEVDLCGHATLASGHVLLQELGRKTQQVCFQTMSGKLTVGVDPSSQPSSGGGHALTLALPSRPARVEEAPARLADALGKPFESFHLAKKAVARLSSAEEVRTCRPDFPFIAQLPSDGLIITAAGDEPGLDFVSRYFAPHVGIEEDPVTGSAHCTLVPLWAELLGIHDRPLRAQQVSKRTGALEGKVEGDQVVLTGRARTFFRGELIS